jgi:hypothetical protein
MGPVMERDIGRFAAGEEVLVIGPDVHGHEQHIGSTGEVLNVYADPPSATRSRPVTLLVSFAPWAQALFGWVPSDTSGYFPASSLVLPEGWDSWLGEESRA